MEIIIFIFIFVLARFTARGLFDSRWHRSVQNKFDSIKKEKKFWRLMKAEYTISFETGEKNTGGLHVRDVFRSYVLSLTRELLLGDFSRQNKTDYSNLDKSIINEKAHWVDNINLLCKKIDEKEKDIGRLLKENTVNLAKLDIQKKFEKVEEESFGFSEEMKKFVALFIRLVEDKNDGSQILTAMKKFEEISRKYEFDSAGDNIKDLNVLASVKIGQFEILEIIINLLCEKIEGEENSLKLQKLLQEREQMKMLQWCIINFSSGWVSGLQRFCWRIADVIFL